PVFMSIWILRRPRPTLFPYTNALPILPDQPLRLGAIAGLVREGDEVADRGGEPRIEVEHAVERDARFAHALVEQAGEVIVELAQHVPRLGIGRGALGGALEAGEGCEAVAAGEQRREAVEQQAVGGGEAALVQHRAPERCAKPLLRRV